MHIKNHYTLLLTLVIAVLAFSCKDDKKEVDKLNIENAVFAKTTNENEILEMEEAVFTPGEKISLYLINVGEFKQGKDGKHHMEMDMSISNAGDEIIFSKKSLLGKDGFVSLNKNIAGSPYATWEPPFDIEEGKYTFTIMVYDKIGNRQTGISRDFKIKSE